MKSAGTRIAALSGQAESGYAKARNQHSGTPRWPKSPLDVRSVRGRRGGCCAHNENDEEAHAIEANDKGIAEKDRFKEVAPGRRSPFDHTATHAGTGASSSFANDRSRSVPRGRHRRCVCRWHHDGARGLSVITCCLGNPNCLGRGKRAIRRVGTTHPGPSIPRRNTRSRSRSGSRIEGHGRETQAGCDPNKQEFCSRVRFVAGDDCDDRPDGRATGSGHHRR
jgi:hypothetical protein